ncbi:hypothetical protein BKA07_000281 [Brevibacterium marinum]|uniref:Uncharacterized protein n=1 Tax=Brevibacterium marinum TaxID=418643 RepID=A0A846RTF9_9MICO|nr:hypothetical protein [Brevibacterium marinum]
MMVERVSGADHKSYLNLQERAACTALLQVHRAEAQPQASLDRGERLVPASVELPNRCG